MKLSISSVWAWHSKLEILIRNGLHCLSGRRWSPDDDVDGRIKATKYFHHCSPIKSEKEREKKSRRRSWGGSQSIKSDTDVAAWRVFGVCRVQLLTQPREMKFQCGKLQNTFTFIMKRIKFIGHYPSLSAYGMWTITIECEGDKETFRQCMGFCRDPIYYE